MNCRLVTNGLRWVLIIGAVCCGAVSSLRAQSFTLDWFTVDGGGGSSAGGAYSVSGTIGQPDAGRMTGGSYTLLGGFWSVAIDDVPRLRITRGSGGTVIISWLNPSPGFQLQETPTLTRNPQTQLIPWAAVGQPPVVAGGEWQVTVPGNVGNRFYRLCRP